MENKRMMSTQHTLNFDAPLNDEQSHVAQQTSAPPPADQVRRSLELVRPDRQIVYDGLEHYAWPAAEALHDRDTITVDRIREDIDGPSHRFVIKRFDTVEVYFASHKVELGEVVGISHKSGEVRVRFTEGTEGLWFYKGQIYPAVEPTIAPKRRGESLSKVIAAVNERHGNELTEADRVPTVLTLVPYTFDDFKKFLGAFRRGDVPHQDYLAEFERLHAGQEEVKGQLLASYKAKELAVLATRFGSWQARRSTKEENARHVVAKMLSAFVLDGSVSYQPLSGESYEQAVAKKVQAVTAGQYARAFEKRQEESLAEEKALTNPETFAEFRTFLTTKGEDALNHEQLAQYDALHADITRERRAKETPTVVAQFESDELQGIAFQVKEGFHDKRQCPLWIVQLTSRVERDAFNELNRKAKMLGGWYSSFKKSDAGFQFLSQENADHFCSLLEGDADRSNVLEARKERKELTAAERLHELADEILRRADETIERSNDSLQNTARRASIQAGVRGQAYADQALSRSMHSIAEALSRGEARYLDGIRHKTHIETLDAVLYRARWNRVRAYKQQSDESHFEFGRRIDRIEDEPIGPQTVRYAEYPFPWIAKRMLVELIEAGRRRPGLKLAAEKMHKRLAREREDFVSFRVDRDVETLLDFIDRAKAAGLDVQWVAMATENYKRLQRANLTDIHELRAALREYLTHRAQARGDDPVSIAERELLGKKLPGFFPTPRPVIERMLELAKVEAEHRVLEPSCGKGDILDALREGCSGIELHAIEQNYSLADVLAAKAHEVEFGDFLEHQASYNRIVMNPPFEDGQDMLHIQHAYSLLIPGGRLVSVISEGPFFRSDRQSVAFREWLDAVGGETERLPEDAFRGRKAFCETGIRTRLLTIDKE
jgi:hypothetical protein